MNENNRGTKAAIMTSSPPRIDTLIPLGQRIELDCNGRKGGQMCGRHELIEPHDLLKVLGPDATFLDGNRRLRCICCDQREIRIRGCVIDHYAICDAKRNASNMGGLEPDGFPNTSKVAIGAILGRGWPITFRCECGAEDLVDAGDLVRTMRAARTGGYETSIENLGPASTTPCRKCGATTWSSTIERSEAAG